MPPPCAIDTCHWMPAVPANAMGLVRPTTLFIPSTTASCFDCASAVATALAVGPFRSNRTFLSELALRLQCACWIADGRRALVTTAITDAEEADRERAERPLALTESDSSTDANVPKSNITRQAPRSRHQHQLVPHRCQSWIKVKCLIMSCNDEAAGDRCTVLRARLPWAFGSLLVCWLCSARLCRARSVSLCSVFLATAWRAAFLSCLKSQ
jgi:hypothetical protein